MKKAYAMLVAASLMLSAASVPAFAAEHSSKEEVAMDNGHTNSSKFGTNSYGNYDSISSTPNPINSNTFGVNRSNTYGTNNYGTYGTNSTVPNRTNNYNATTNQMKTYGTNSTGTGIHANNYRTLANDTDNDMDWGWLGLLGLAGLFGLRSRDRERT